MRWFKREPKRWRGLTDKELLKLVKIVIPKATRLSLPAFKAQVDARYDEEGNARRVQKED